MQIVLVGNRVVAHGEDCFLCMGGTVVCEESGRSYSNATVAEVEAIPADIDSVGYEYHAGVFVPCAPYGKGYGNLAVVCNDDCKAIKDSGLPFSGLLSDDTKTLFGLGADAVPDDAFAKLSESVFANKVPKYNNSTTMSALAVGQSVFINIDGAPVEFLVANQGLPEVVRGNTEYDASCNGTWLLAKDIYEKRQWHTSNTADYENSAIHAYLNSEFLGMIDPDVQSIIKEIKIPYRPGTSGTTVNSGANGLSAKVFLPSVPELNAYSGTNQALDGQPLDLFHTDAHSLRIAYFNGVASEWWTRSVNTYGSSNGSWNVTAAGAVPGSNLQANEFGIRPMFILPSDAEAYLDESGNAYAKQEYDTMLCDPIGNPYVVSGESIADRVQIAAGSYLGTGTYTSAGANSLTFDFVPKIIFFGAPSCSGFLAKWIVGSDSNLIVYDGNGASLTSTGSYSQAAAVITYRNSIISISGTTISWYAGSNYSGNSYHGPVAQMNVSGTTYYYVAIG